MFVFGLFMLVGLSIEMLVNASKQKFDIGVLLMFVYVVLTMVK